MTPIIQKAVKMAPEPESALWFDVGAMNDTEAKSVPLDVLLNLPFKRTGVAGTDSTGKEFYLTLTQGTDSVAVGGASITHGKYLEPFAYIKTDEGLKFYRKNRSVDEKEIRPGLRMVFAVLDKLASGGRGYKPIPQDTYINRKRKAKGKSALSFDWHTVEIGPKHIKKEHQGGTHASPRLHDRRGHWRKLKNGNSVWVKSCKVGDATKGAVFKDYKVVAAQ